MKIKNKKGIEIQLGINKQLDKTPCPKCKGHLITNFGVGISHTFCVDCDYDEYDYDL